MGGWNTKPFGNDTASDWLYELQKAADDRILTSALQAVQGASPRIDASTGEIALAAATVVWAARNEPVKTLPEIAQAWVKHRGYVPPDAIVDMAIFAVQLVLQASELRELWKESRSFSKWENQTAQLLRELQESRALPVLVRTAKPPGQPRLLYKLIETVSPDSSGPAREKLNKALTELIDVNAELPRSFLSPLSAVAKQGLNAEAALLLQRGADINPPSDLLTSAPLTHAAGSGHVEMINFLLANGAHLHDEILINAENGSRVLAGHPNAVPFRFSPALWYAVSMGSIPAVDALLRHGADLHQKDLNGESLLHKAAYAGQTEMIEYLVRRGIDVNTTKSRNEGPIHLAVAAGRTDALRRLLELGADPNMQREGAWSALEEAKDRWPELVPLLIQHGAR
ncbi:MAG: ankyrin repeat domain-containing protein [Candidatus Sumerlaeaceae bacterium]